MEKAAKPKYKIIPEYKGMTCYTCPPSYKRKDGAVFILDDNLSQTDMGFLKEVLNYEGIEIAE
jgi:hypothetical protein